MVDELLHTIADGIATVTFNRPETRNGMTPAYLETFIALVKTLEANKDVRVLLFTGAGEDFSSGGDKAFLQTLRTMTSEQVREVVYRAFLGAVRTVKLCAKPTVAAINGGAVGGGCEVAIACDFRIVTPKSYFYENWTEIGLIPPLGGMFLLPRLIGLERASNMIMRAQRVYGEEALAIGLASKLVAPEQLAQEAHAFALDLARRSSAALAMAKVGLRRGMDGTLAGEWDFNVLAQSTLIGGPDFTTALDAMDQRRKPVL
jgi:enoyl-CoA hydratase/carnithine racemase